MVLSFALNDILSANLVPECSIHKVDKYSKIPNFINYKTPAKRIQYFYTFLTPIVNNENSKILCDRRKLTRIMAQTESKKLRENDINWLKQKAAYYKLRSFSYNNEQDLKKLKGRIDIIPVEIVLSQAAIESAYGTSGFARRANNLFGMRTYSKTNGLIPQNIPQNSGIYVAKYESVNQSVQSYCRNLNTHKAYANFRKKRSELRAGNSPLDPFQLVTNLIAYSEEGPRYINKITRVMEKNVNLLN